MDPASYRGIYLSSAIAKLYEGLLLARITKYTERFNILTDNQLGTRRTPSTNPRCNLLPPLHYPIQLALSRLPTYVAIIDYTTAYPSVHRDSLYYHLHSCGIRGHIWHQMRARLSKIMVQVLHPNISKDTYTTILRGLPEGSRLSPTLFGIVL
jgi:hypothetical protein